MIKKYDKFFVSLNYITNYNPLFFKNYKKFNFLNKNKIFCRNFFLFLFLLKYINNVYNFNNIKLFIKPFKKKLNTILRAPYRYKLTRHQISLFRYNINIKIYFPFNLIFFKKLFFLKIFIKKFNFLFIFLENNLIFNHKIKLFFNFKVYKNFNFLI